MSEEWSESSRSPVEETVLIFDSTYSRTCILICSNTASHILALAFLGPEAATRPKPSQASCSCRACSTIQSSKATKQQSSKTISTLKKIIIFQFGSSENIAAKEIAQVLANDPTTTWPEKAAMAATLAATTVS